MSSPWTAPGQSDPAAGSAPGPTAPGTEPAAWDAPGAGGSAGPAPTGTAPGAPGPSGGPRRELVRTDHLFPLRPLNLGEILGAALRIYRVNPRAVLGVAAIVYAIATLLSTLASGMSLVPMIGEIQVMLDDPTGDYVGDPLMGGVSTIISSVVSGLLTLVAAALVTVALTRVTMDAAVGRRSIPIRRARRSSRSSPRASTPPGRASCRGCWGGSRPGCTSCWTLSMAPRPLRAAWRY
ncbi:hypothetical protein [Brachybacterium sp. Marseille-Q7125]|uniref:hypothetical protein n=1 Tax=Brachybacterium sp. Marseille-Q7125 TaxID=2932815 RepID=UPI001FF40E47|nr:hypothetical protein [Brachybacterium sp. Marseille-Q7125]